eukprot:32593_1
MTLFILNKLYWFFVSLICAVPVCYITKKSLDPKYVRSLIVSILWLLFCAVDIVLTFIAFLYSILLRAPFLTLTSGSNPSPTTQKQSESCTSIVICGYSFAGFEVHKLLQNNPSLKHCTFTIIEPKNYFEFTPSILATMIKPSNYKSISFPLSKCFDSNRSTLIRGKATSIASNSLTVLMRDGSTKTVPFDFCFLCTGSKYASPIKVNVYPTVEDNVNYQNRERILCDIYNKLAAPSGHQNVGIIGGGPVGVELAAEIIQHFPTKHVTIMDLAPHLCSPFPTKTQRYIEDWFIKRSNITLKLKTYIRDIVKPHSATNETDKFKVMVSPSLDTPEPETLEFDTVFRCAGFQPNTELLQSTESDASFKPCLSEKYKFIQVDDWMRVGKHGNIFALGDVVQQPHINEVKLAHTAEIHALYLNKLMGYLCDNDSLKAESFTPYHEWLLGEKITKNSKAKEKKWNMPLVYTISLGEMEGSMGFGSICLNGFVTQILKWLIEVSLCSLYHRTGIFDINLPIGNKPVLLFRLYPIGYRVFTVFWWFNHHFTMWYIRRFNQN